MALLKNSSWQYQDDAMPLEVTWESDSAHGKVVLHRVLLQDFNLTRTLYQTGAYLFCLRHMTIGYVKAENALQT